jgi:rod shape determining protein RodA
MPRSVDLSKFDWALFVIVCFFSTLSFFFVWSASSEQFAYKQIVWIGIGMGICFILLIFDYFVIAKFSYVYYSIVLIGLLLVLLFGKTVYGAKRWLMLGPVTIQPSEFMKIALILALSRYFMYKDNISKISNILIPLFLTILPMLLIIKQPDLGTSLTLLPVFFAIVYIAGARLKYIFYVIMIGLSSIPLFWFFVLKSYQKARVISLLWPEKVSDLDEGYHKIQSLIAIGSGGFWGSGWGTGVQSQLNFLPQGHTDFIFSVIAEEWGFLRSFVILCSYLVFLACSIGIALKTRESYGRLIVTGFTAMFATQIFINVAMTVGLAPITGLTLPFISYGGSSLLSSFIALSFILSVRLRTREVWSKQAFYE